MSKVKLGDVAVECRETCKGSKDGYPIVGLEHLVPGEVTLTAWDEAGDTTFNKMFRKGSVLFGRRRAYLRKAAVAPFDGICSSDITVIKANQDRLVPELLPFIIQNDGLFDFAVGKSAGSLSPRVKWEHLKNYEFELPDDMAKQQELAELLWAIDATKKSYQRLISATDELVKSQFIEMFGDPIINDKKWPTMPLKKVAPEYSPKIPNQLNYWWLNLDMIEPYSGTIQHKVMEKKENIGASTSTFNNTMVMYSKLRPYLNKVTVPDSYGYATNELIGLKPNETILNKFFLFNLLRSDQFVSYASGLSVGEQMPRMPVKFMREFTCILPPLALQEKFVRLSEQSDKSKFTFPMVLRYTHYGYSKLSNYVA